MPNVSATGETCSLMAKQVRAFKKAVSEGCTQGPEDVRREIMEFRDLCFALEEQRDELLAALEALRAAAAQYEDDPDLDAAKLAADAAIAKAKGEA